MCRQINGILHENCYALVVISAKSNFYLQYLIYIMPDHKIYAQFHFKRRSKK